MNTYKYFDKNPIIRGLVCQEYLNDMWIKMEFITQDRLVKQVMQMEKAENRVQLLAFVKDGTSVPLKKAI
jgi:hypothetical protein